jgi:hypothetical protein
MEAAAATMTKAATRAARIERKDGSMFTSDGLSGFYAAT